MNDLFDGDDIEAYATATGANGNTGTTPQDPMASLAALLAAYDLGAGDTVYVDAGTYTLATAINISSDDAGVTIVGPNNGQTAVFDRDNHTASEVAFHLDNADGVTLSHLVIRNAGTGILVSNDSDNVQLDHLEVYDNNEYGVRVEANSDGVSIANSVWHGDGTSADTDQRWNLWVAGAAATIENNVAYHTHSGSPLTVGIFVDTQGDITVRGNETYGNSGNGLQITASGQIAASDNVSYDNRVGMFFEARSAAEVGDIYGNIAFDNTTHGFELEGRTHIRDSESYGNATGVYMNVQSTSVARGMSVHDNSTGVNMRTGALLESRVYGNEQFGVVTFGNAFAVELGQNRIYANDVGVYSQALSNTNRIHHNVVYANTTTGIQLNDASTQGGSTTEIINNTVYEPAATAVVIDGNSRGVDLRNNILWAGGVDNVAVRVGANAQRDLTADYNLYRYTNGATAAERQIELPTLLSWQLETGLDRHSFVGDPAFVDPLGDDGVLGAGGATNGHDDNFALSSLSGSYFSGTWTAQTEHSSAIDAGDPNSPADNEHEASGDIDPALTTQAGERINLGAEGNTPTAARSPASILQLLTPTNVQRLRVGRPTSIAWHSSGIANDVRIELVDLSTGFETVHVITASTENDGEFSWMPTFATGQARWRITGTSEDGITPIATQSPDDFAIAAAGVSFYVNDSAASDEDVYTSSIGQYTSTGTTPTDPLPSLAAVLHAYEPHGEEVIYVDAGRYDVVTNLQLTVAHQGLTIQGPVAPSLALLDRGSQGIDQSVFQIGGAAEITVGALKVTGARIGLSIENSSHVTVQGVTAFDNRDTGFFVDNASSQIALEGNVAYGTTGNSDTDQNTGFLLNGEDMRIERNVAYKVGTQLHRGFDIDATGDLVVWNNEAFNNQVGMFIRAESATVANNTAHDNDTGFSLDDFSAASVSTAYDNEALQNDLIGFDVSRNFVLYRNVATENATGVYVDQLTSSVGTDLFLGSPTPYENQIYANNIGVDVRAGTVQFNRVFGNDAIGIRALQNPSTIRGNVVFGNSTGLDVGTISRGTTVSTNLVYDNTNEGIYVHATGTSGTQPNAVVVVHNTVWHEVGTAVRLINNGNAVLLSDNNVVIQGGVGISIEGNTTGLSSDYNNLYAATGGADVGRWQATTASDLADWQSMTSQDANSLAVDPAFRDRDGRDNRLGWDQIDAFSPLVDFGRDDDFQLSAHSPLIDRGSYVTASGDLWGVAAHDDPATAGGASAVDIGAFEFFGNSNDTASPTINASDPPGVDEEAALSSVATSLDLIFSDSMNAVLAERPSGYDLRNSGLNGVFGDADDVTIVLSPTYSTDSALVRLAWAGPLPAGTYQLTLFGTAHADNAGNLLDGESAAIPGSDYVRVFQVLAGDFDGSGDVDAHDIDALYSVIDSDSVIDSGNASGGYDLDGDGDIDQGDVDHLVHEILGTEYGDANLDGQVDATDFGAWDDHRFTSGTGWAEADFNGDGVTDGLDFNVWNAHKFHESASMAHSSNPSRVPRSPLSVGDSLTIDASLIARDLVLSEHHQTTRGSLSESAPEVRKLKGVFNDRASQRTRSSHESRRRRLTIAHRDNEVARQESIDATFASLDALFRTHVVAESVPDSCE
ncbi:MAG: right-handed parallel beta-helix repeat-containing protein [Planctomycetales bacterium]|nr:right-handed parallel beta-helix repeat-containing protein [Planctomycetales bacterium]